ANQTANESHAELEALGENLSDRFAELNHGLGEFFDDLEGLVGEPAHQIQDLAAELAQRVQNNLDCVQGEIDRSVQHIVDRLAHRFEAADDLLHDIDADPNGARDEIPD